MAEHGHDSEAAPDHGRMDISEQEKTFAGFSRLVARGTALIIGVLIFLALVNG